MMNYDDTTTQGQQLPDAMLQPQYMQTINHGHATERLDLAINKVKSELVHGKKNLLIEQIKNTIIELVYYSEKQIKINFSDHLSQKLGYNYTYMANLFSKVNGSSIKHFIITTRIERVKELLVYEGMSITEISEKLHYSSVAHLSDQFKKITGLCPSRYLASLAAKAHLGIQDPESVPEVKKDSIVLPFITNGNDQDRPRMMEG